MAEKLSSGKIGVKPCVGTIDAHSGDFDMTEMLLENGFLTCPQTAIMENLYFGPVVVWIHKDAVGKV